MSPRLLSTAPFKFISRSASTIVICFLLYQFALGHFCLLHIRKLWPIILDQRPSGKRTGDELTKALSKCGGGPATPIQARMLCPYDNAFHPGRSFI